MRPGSACRANRDVPLKQRRVGVTAADRDRHAVATGGEPTAQAKGHLSVTDVHVPREDPVAASIDCERATFAVPAVVQVPGAKSSEHASELAAVFLQTTLPAGPCGPVAPV